MFSIVAWLNGEAPERQRQRGGVFGIARTRPVGSVRRFPMIDFTFNHGSTITSSGLQSSLTEWTFY